MRTETEQIDLIRNIKKGDKRSLELIFRRLYPRLCTYAQKFIHDINDAEEIVQELFYTVWKHRDRLDENQSLQSYLFTAVKNRSLNLLESRKSKSKRDELLWYLYSQQSTDNNNAHQALLASDLEESIVIAVEHLPKECKKIFELSRFEGLKYQEIAQRLNISLKTVETQMSRALFKLRVELREYLPLVIFMCLIK